MLINFSNHPISQWESNQIKEAEEMYGNCVDLPFPHVDPAKDKTYTESLANEYLKKIIGLLEKTSEKYVHIMGELTFTNIMVDKLKKNNIKCLASTSNRKVKIIESGEKVSFFHFVRFREY